PICLQTCRLLTCGRPYVIETFSAPICSPTSPRGLGLVAMANPLLPSAGLPARKDSITLSSSCGASSVTYVRVFSKGTTVSGIDGYFILASYHCEGAGPPWPGELSSWIAGMASIG